MANTTNKQSQIIILLVLAIIIGWAGIARKDGGTAKANPYTVAIQALADGKTRSVCVQPAGTTSEDLYRQCRMKLPETGAASAIPANKNALVWCDADGIHIHHIEVAVEKTRCLR